MAPLTDPARLKAFKDALGNWRHEGFIKFELNETALKWVKQELSNVTHKGIGRLMCKHIQAGGEIDEVPETRPQWDDYEFHHDLRFTIQGRPVYIETRLNYQLPFVPDESTIVVVNIHAP